MKKIIITQQRSAINRTQRQKRTLVALGLKGIGQSIEHNATDHLLAETLMVKNDFRVAPHGE